MSWCLDSENQSEFDMQQSVLTLDSWDFIFKCWSYNLKLVEISYQELLIEAYLGTISTYLFLKI